MSTPAAPPALPAFRDAVGYWLKLGCISFGGPAGQIAIMHRELVERRRWISEDHFLHALNFCMFLPGPEAQQLATYLGWRLHGWRGGLAAGALFVVPSMFILFGLSWIYMVHGEQPWLKAIFYGLLAAVMAVVAEAVLRIGKKALKSPSLWALAALSFIGIHFFQVSFVIIILSAAVIGGLGHWCAPQQFPAGQNRGTGEVKPEPGFLTLPPAPAATWHRSAVILTVCLALWWIPIAALGLWLGWHSTGFQQGVFFSQTALITFGGAYAVLPYVAAEAVGKFHWLSHPQMMAGLALAETTPGPLIMVLQFVGFVGGWGAPPPGMSPLTGATIGALVTTWATFVPCFLFVFLGAPHVEHLRRRPRLGAALTAITAAVVGVILNLGVNFSVHALWPAGRFDWFIAGLALAAFLALWRLKAGLIPVLAACAGLGFAWWFGVR
jgi:chromate transporter